MFCDFGYDFLMKKLPLSQKQETYTYYNGDKYVGGFKNNELHGVHYF